MLREKTYMKKVIIFNIRNIQDDYAKCLKCIETTDIENEIRNIPKTCIGYIESQIDNNTYKIACEVERREAYNLKADEKIDFHNLLWCFRITIEKEDDIVNLMYFYLIKQLYKNVIAILVTPDTEYDMKVSAYLSFEIEKDRNTLFIKTVPEKVIQYGEVHRLPGSSMKDKRERKLTKFLPLIEVSAETYDFLAGTVETAQRKLSETDKNYIWKKTVISTCANLLMQHNRVQHERMVAQEEFANAIGNISVLTYILFCSFRNHCMARRNSFEITKIEQELSDARDIAEGILQILENIIHHSKEKRGYFSFRIHDKNKSGYLKNNYLNYISRNGNNTFLEIFIADCYLAKGQVVNENILCKQFTNNLKKRSFYDKEIEPFVEKYKDLEAKDFFDNEIWKEYNAVSDNIIEHYGIQLFDKIVNSNNGCFELISTANYMYTEKQRYCVVKEDRGRNTWVLPGTQYRILLPITEKRYSQKYAGMDFCDYSEVAMLQPIVEQIEVNNIDLEKIIIDITKKINQDKQYTVDKKNLKHKLIYELSEQMYVAMEESIHDSSHIAHFLLDRIRGAGLVEIIFKACLKALIRLRKNVGNERKIYLAFGRLTREFITEFCYLMGIYYYKADKSRIMMNTEMYLWDAGCCEDLLIYGEDLNIAHNAITERAVLRGIYPQWINFIDYVWRKYECNDKHENKNSMLSTLPYDVIIKNGGKTIFENVVEKVLNKSFEHHQLGCLISKIHVQLASKIHITEFYNGQILFLNNYFTNYFSYLIVDKISSCLPSDVDKKRNIVLVGYESYSEMLLVETSDLLRMYIEKKKLSKIYEVRPYIIGEVTEKKIILRNEKGCFDEKNRLAYQEENNVFVFIVPINSTLITFEKLQIELEKNLNIKLNEKNIFLNYALILSRDNYMAKCDRKENRDSIMSQEEEEYWKEKKGHEIVTKGKETCVHYFIEVCGNWEEASRCKLCFPQNYICEKPLVKTDITGLLPLTQLGQKKKWLVGNNISRENMSRLRLLSEVLTYNHIQRGENHYLYYFDTSTFFYQNQLTIKKWLDTLRTGRETDNKAYNFIVSPLHATNAGFTEVVNKVLFNNTAHVIRMDFCKIYRSNFMQQFSYLQILYRNIMQYSETIGWHTEINFYFVDDEIVSGKTIIRAKSLIDGLFAEISRSENIKINVFKKIIVLINRLSDASKHNFIENIENFKSFVEFNISRIQNHDEFCFMCKLVSRADRYKHMSGTNRMDEEWGRIEKKFKVKDYAWAEQNEEYRQSKYKSRMIAAHYAEAEMWNLADNSEMEAYFRLIVDKLFYRKLYKKDDEIALSKNNQEKFVSYIKTLSRPFFVYRNRLKEAAMHLIISFCESLLGTEFEKIWNELKVTILFERNYLDIVKKEMRGLYDFLIKWRQEMNDSTYALLLDLLEQLADMESAYLIRKNNIIRIFQLYNMIGDKKFGNENSNEKELAKKKFELRYGLFIKQITNEDSDETKSIWVEHLFYFGRELNSREENDVEFFNHFFGYETSFGKNILLENTKIVYDGVKCLAEIVDNSQWKKYELAISEQKENLTEIEDDIKNKIKTESEKIIGSQLKYFKQFLEYYKYDEKVEKIYLEVLFFGMMFNVNAEGIPFEAFYRKFYWIIKELTGAEVQILMIPNEIELDNELFYHDAPCIIYDRRKELNRKRQIKLQDRALIDVNFLRNVQYELDTYFIDK